MNEISALFGNLQLWLVQNAGWLITVGIVVFFVDLLVNHGKSPIFVIGLIFILVPLTARWAPPLWTSSGIGGADDAQSIVCKRWPDKCVQGYQSVDAGAVLLGQDGGGMTIASSSSLSPSLAYQVKPNAGDIWLEAWTKAIGGSLTPADGINGLAASPAGFPPSVVSTTCLHCLPGEAGEKWEMKLVFENASPITIVVNGKVARYLGVAVDSKEKMVTTFEGTGTWQAVCPQCLEPVAETGQRSAVVIPTTSAQTTELAANEYRITDSSGGGAYWYQPVSGSCDGVAQSKSGIIPFGTTVTVAQEFPGVGWVSYLGNKDMVLTTDNKCIFKGTIGK
jgi:hypothetical protein